MKINFARMKMAAKKKVLATKNIMPREAFVSFDYFASGSGSIIYSFILILSISPL